MILFRPAALACILCAPLLAPAQSSAAKQSKAAPSSQNPRRTEVAAATVPLNRTVIVLDPAHGGSDGGSHIGDSIQEKNVTLALGFKLRSLLEARGFTVVMTRDDDAASAPKTPGAPLTLDERAGIANHEHAVACLLLHATGSGDGIHLYSSELGPTAGVPAIAPWLSAQAPWVLQSRALESALGSALTRAEVPLVISAASVRPMDSLECPAVIIELAPQDDTPESVEDANYQTRVAQAIAGALVFWRDKAAAPLRLSPSAGAGAPHSPAAGAHPAGGSQP